MEEALQNILDYADKQAKNLTLDDYRDLMHDLSAEIYTRYESAENDLSRLSGDEK